ncbi:hypothetical protein PSPO01_06764 [Paraphaeosphaeria sporulosa]
MGDVPNGSLPSAAGGDMAYPVSNGHGDNAKEDELFGPGSRKTRLCTPSPPPLFTFGKADSRTTWYRQATSGQNYVQLVVEREGFPNGAVIADRLDPRLLFQVAPGLQKRLEGRRIFVPPASCLDEETIESMLFGLLRCAKQGIPVPGPVEKKPVGTIAMHCVLVFFEMEKEARDLETKLWDMLQQVKLTPMDVLWIWDTFSGRVQSEPYTAPFAHEYVQMMAWQILNLDAVGMLDDDIRHLIGLEKEPKYFTQTIEARFKTHGLGKDALVPESNTKVPVLPQTTKTETWGRTANDIVDGQKDNSGPAVAKQAGKPSIKDETKSSDLAKPTAGIKAPEFKSVGLTDVFKSPSLRLTPFETPDHSTTKTVPAPPKFNFSRASTNILADSGAAPRSTAQASSKRSGMFPGNAKDERQNNMGLNALKNDVTPAGFRFKLDGSNASNSIAPNVTATPSSSSSGFRVTAPPQSQFGGLGQPPVSTPTQATAPSSTSVTAVTLGFGSSSATRPATGAPSLPSFMLGASGGPTFNPFGSAHAPDTSTLTLPTQSPAPKKFNSFHTPNTGFQSAVPSQASPKSGFGGGAAASSGDSQNPFPNARNTFNTPTSNASFKGAFGTSASNPVSNAGSFGATFNSFAQPAPNTAAPGNTGFSVSTNFAGQLQQSTGFGGNFQSQNSNETPFSNSFASLANNGGADGNRLTFQGNSGGGAGSSQSGAGSSQSGAMGGMVRRIAKATGPKRRR